MAAKIALKDNYSYKMVKLLKRIRMKWTTQPRATLLNLLETRILRSWQTAK